MGKEKSMNEDTDMEDYRCIQRRLLVDIRVAVATANLQSDRIVLYQDIYTHDIGTVQALLPSLKGIARSMISFRSLNPSSHMSVTSSSNCAHMLALISFFAPSNLLSAASTFFPLLMSSDFTFLSWVVWNFLSIFNIALLPLATESAYRFLRPSVKERCYS